MRNLGLPTFFVGGNRTVSATPNFQENSKIGGSDLGFSGSDAEQKNTNLGVGEHEVGELNLLFSVFSL
jgi:hypothetical protein